MCEPGLFVCSVAFETSLCDVSSGYVREGEQGGGDNVFLNGKGDKGQCEVQVKSGRCP